MGIGISLLLLQLFLEITDEVKLDFTHEPGRNNYFMPEIMAAGGAFLDYDDDGDLDIYLLQGTDSSTNALFRQNAEGIFENVTVVSGTGDGGYGMGVAVGDIDNDGRVDVYVSNYGRDTLYRNLGEGNFENVSARAGISGDAWSASAVFCDYDADGFLDLYVTHYLVYNPNRDCYRNDGSQDYCSPQIFPGQSDTLYRNNGNGTLTDVSREAGITSVSAPGLGVVCQDLDDDGRLDFYVANDGAANQLWLNEGDGTFEDRAFLNGVALNSFGQTEAGMGVSAGDVDDNGSLDLFLTHITEETNTLYLRETLGFADATNPAGLGPAGLKRTGFGAALFDYDHDGRLDLAVVNGRVQRHPALGGADLEPFWRPYAEPNLLFNNDGRARFTDMSGDAGGFTSTIEVSRGLAVGDVDGDGDLDLLVTNTAGRARLYRNDAEKKGRWLSVRAYDPSRRRDAHGARVTIVVDGRAIVRSANPGFSYLSSSDPRAHFGLPATGTIEKIMVRWPDGSEEAFPGAVANRAIVLEKAGGTLSP